MAVSRKCDSCGKFFSDPDPYLAMCSVCSFDERWNKAKNEKILAKPDKKWYYHFSCLEFEGFSHTTEGSSRSIATGGPFETFNEAKEDAIEFLQHSLAMARSTLRMLRSSERGDFE